MSTLEEFLRSLPPPEPAPQAALSSNDATTLIASLTKRGVTCFVRDNRLFVDHPNLLTPADVEILRIHRDALIALSNQLVGDPPILTELPTPVIRTMHDFLLGASPPRQREPDWVAQPPPSLAGIDRIILNFETNGLDWRRGHRPIGVTVSSLDGQLKQFLPFGFRSGNLDEATVKEWFRREVRNKQITNANTRFEVHMAREWGCDLEEQGNQVSDIQHTAALLDDWRKRFALDVLANDFLGGIEVPRVDETRMADYDAHEVAARAEYQVYLVAALRSKFEPMLAAQDLQQVQALEDTVIYPVCEMEKNGSPLDEELLEQMSVECNTRHHKLLMEIAEEVGFAFDHSPTSWQRLFEQLHIPPSYLDTGKQTFAEDIVGAIDHPIIKKAHMAGQLASLNSKIFKAYRQGIIDGNLYYDINQLRGDEGGTVSGRFSIGYVQQVPNHDNHHAAFGIGEVDVCKGMCDMFPRRLYKSQTGDYLEADAAQIEYRLFAHFAQNERVLQAYREKPDLSYHKETWAMMKQYKPDMLYTHQKSFNFARQYGAKSVKLALMMGFIDAKEAQWIRDTKSWNDPRLKTIHEIEQAYGRMMPEGDQLLAKAAHLAKPNCDEFCKKGDALHNQFEHRGYVRTLLGRRSRFQSAYKVYIGLNRVIQGSASDIMKQKLVELHRERKHTGFLMRLTCHDAVGGDAKMPETHERVAEILNRQSFTLKVPILWETKTGQNWAGCK